MRNLRVAWQLHDLTLGQVWAVDLQRNEGIVKDVIATSGSRRNGPGRVLEDGIVVCMHIFAIQYV